MSHAIATIVKGGIVLIPLLLCSLISLALTIERLLIWRRISSAQIANESMQRIARGNFADAKDPGRNSPHPRAAKLTNLVEPSEDRR